MKKLNLADIVSNEFYEFVDRYVKGKHKKRDKDILKAVVGVLECTPHIVRCKDCRYALPSSENAILCTAPCESQYPKAYKPIDWFCAGGERKEGDGE